MFRVTRATFCSVGMLLLSSAYLLATQVPVVSGQLEQYPVTFDDADITSWNLREPPDPNATDHLIFETVYSLLLHWPNTRMRNGHTIVPGTIPKGTLLYHCTNRKELPPGSEWVAMDPELSYRFCWRDPPEGWHLTLMTTRPLKVVYFDGGSSIKLPYGSLDTQDLIAWGRIGGLFKDEVRRIQDLCIWGNGFGVDGFLRMGSNFELMLCDFTSGVSVVSFVKLVEELAEGLPLPDSGIYEAMHAGSWHYRFPGETRIQLHLAGLVSFYDTQLAPSLIPIRYGQERWDHRVQNVSSEDLSAIKSMLEANLMRPIHMSSGVDWKTLFQVVTDRYAQRLELMQYLLNSSATHPEEIIDRAKKAQTQLRIMLTPYILLSATPTGQPDDAGLDWTIPVYKLCAGTHTQSMESWLDSMSHPEKSLLRAVRGTSREICRVVIKMWAAGVYAGVDPSLNTKKSPDVHQLIRLQDIWVNDLERLMSWLDWSVWVKCRPRCGPEERCHLPTWPIRFPQWRTRMSPPSYQMDTPHSGSRGSTDLDPQRRVGTIPYGYQNIPEPRPETDEWVRPQPKCIRKISPYDF